MSWRAIDRTETDLLVKASRVERDFPVFYRDASNTRTATEADILGYYGTCEYLYGIFDAAELIGLLYFQRITDTHKEVHFDMERGANRAILLDGCRGVRDDRFRNGTLSTETWALKRNRPIQMMLGHIKFRHTGLEMRKGSSHGNVLRWVQLLIRKEWGLYDEIEN